MPFGSPIAGASPRGVFRHPLLAVLCLALAAPAQAGWFSHKPAATGPSAPASASVMADALDATSGASAAATTSAPTATPADAPAATAVPVTVTEAAGASANAAIPANLDRLPQTPGNSTLENLGDDAVTADNDGLTSGEAAADDADGEGSDPYDEFEVVLPSVEESDLDDSEVGNGQYSAEELAAMGNLWDRLRKGAGIDTSLDNERIEIQRNWYLKNSTYLDRMARRATRYLHHTISEAEKRGMPAELALLPIIESAYDPFAYSHANAAGMWQFIPGTARYMGVKQNDWFDGRRDVLESTRAAYDFLELLYRKFGDWQHVLAAYNAGPGAVQRAINRNQAAGLPTDFWSLRLPAETRSYVPRFLAVAQIIKDPEAYGVNLRPVLNQPFFRVISINSQVDMPQAASLAGVSLKEFYQLNPGFKRQFTDPEGPHRLLVPAGLPDDFEADIAALPVPNATLAQHYTVKRGDTLYKVARQFGMTPQALRELNKLSSDKLAAGRTLTIARGNVSPEYLALRQEMKLDRSPLAPRQVVKSKIYKVKRGDTLGSIARRHGVSVKALAKLNGIGTRAKLRPGQVLTLKQVKTTTRFAKAGKGTQKITYKVKKGDTLSSIARRHNVSVKQIQGWNGKRSTINPGQKLVLHLGKRVR